MPVEPVSGQGPRLAHECPGWRGLGFRGGLSQLLASQVAAPRPASGPGLHVARLCPVCVCGCECRAVPRVRACLCSAVSAELSDPLHRHDTLRVAFFFFFQFFVCLVLGSTATSRCPPQPPRKGLDEGGRAPVPPFPRLEMQVGVLKAAPSSYLGMQGAQVE